MWPLIGILSIHCISDFFLQSDWMALGKSKRLTPLLAHSGLYALSYLGMLQLFNRTSAGAVQFALITWILHTLTDYITSRITTKLWFIDLKPIPKPEDGISVWEFYARFIPGYRHWFFCAIGVDQWIHQVTLIATWYLVYGS